MKKQIIDYLKRNRVTTTEVADCLNKSGALEDVLSINKGHYRAGNVKWVYAYNETNWDVHEQIMDTQEGDIVFIDAVDCKGRAVIGELVSKYLLLYKQASAIIANSKFRDAGALIRENYPIWCTGVTPIGCFNKKPEPPLDKKAEEEHRIQYDGAIAVCDDCGVVIIPQELHTEEFLNKLIAIEEQEDIWFERLDRHKESTFEIVCLKTYLNKQK
ncbi:MAG TPA: demethylmenaquinone methyltransferase [Rikenellaceae bacterium]|nr:demethylmenaquinone methyltransferase [Rikenellaceae bacterium]